MTDGKDEVGPPSRGRTDAPNLYTCPSETGEVPRAGARQEREGEAVKSGSWRKQAKED